MSLFTLEGSSEYCLKLSENPKRFDADSPVTNLFFDDTNGQVFTVRSGGVTGVTVTGIDESKNTSFRMEDKGAIVSIKFSLDHKVLAIQRNLENQTATVEFHNFNNLEPTNVEYTHTCKWKNAKILGFVWPKVNEIAYVTDHGIELLQVYPDKKTLKSLKNTSFSGAWFSWCPQSGIILLASNNGSLLQPFIINNSTITKLQKLELESGRGWAERDVSVLRVGGATWCAVFKHSLAPRAAPGPTEVHLLPICGGAGGARVLRTGLSGRFALHVVDDMPVVHHQSSQSSLVFELSGPGAGAGAGGTAGAGGNAGAGSAGCGATLVCGSGIRPASVAAQPCPMYSSNWVVFQPDYMIDARLGCLWQVSLDLTGLLHNVPRTELGRMAGVLLRRTAAAAAPLLYRLLHQLMEQAGTYLAEITDVFDEINAVYRQWAEHELSRNTAGATVTPAPRATVVITQQDMCSKVIMPHLHHKYIVQVVTAYIASLSRFDITLQSETAELAARTHTNTSRLVAAVRRGCLTDGKLLSCQLLSMAHVRPAAAQLALDMMWRLHAHEEVIEVLLSSDNPVPALGVARNTPIYNMIPASKLLSAARGPQLVALYRILQARDEFARIRRTHDLTEFHEQVKKLTEE